MNVKYTNLVRVAIDDTEDIRVIGPFLDWCHRNNIYHENVGATIEGGRFRGFFTPANAKKVRDFLSNFKDEK